MDKVDFEFKINNKYYNEYYARYLLESFYGEAFKNARIADRPDIWVENAEGGGIGIEVTTLLDTYYNTLKKYKKAWSKQGVTLEQIVKNMPALLRNKVGVNEYGNLVLIGNGNRHTLSKSLTGLDITIKAKLEKLQSYKRFESQNLFIFATNLHSDCSVEKIYEKIKKIDLSRYPKVFENIMIFNYDEVQIYPLEMAGEVEIYPVSEDIKFYCDKLAEMEKTRVVKEYDERVNLRKQRAKSEPKPQKLLSKGEI